MAASMASAKVNLFLHVGPVKPNGRHDLDSLVVFAGADAADCVRAEPSDALRFEICGPRAAEAGRPDDNLVLRAARALQTRAQVRQGARLCLDKHLPVAAGLGGGSSDAAATLRVLTDMWRLDASIARDLAPSLGGDVPVALMRAPALMRGEGERLMPVAGLPPLPAVLVNPGVPCPTGPVFAAFDAAGGGADFREIERMPEFSSPEALATWLLRQRNDLEAPARAAVPEIADALRVISAEPSNLLARMSGSGATCFGLFAGLAQAEAARDRIRTSCPGWWVVSTVLGAGA